MEHLIDLIRSEFELAQYKPLDMDGLLWKHKDYNDFWLICINEGDLDLERLQEKVYNDLAPLRKDYPESEKSTSLLIIQHVKKVDDKNPQQVIDGENNVYYFKKYIIQFTTDEWNKTRQAIPEDYKSLGQMLMNSDVFERVKANENSPYLLLYTIAHKLPFVMMKAERRNYNPNPTFVFNTELQPVFAWTEGMRDMAGKNASEDEIAVAKVAINKFVNAKGNG